MRVYLDDTRDTPPGCVRTMTAPETIELLKPGRVRALSLDHDLGDDDVAGTGYDVLVWLELEVASGRFVGPLPYMETHTGNAAALPRMQAAIEQIKRLWEKNRAPAK